MWEMRRALLLACVLALAGCGGSDEATRAPAQAPAPTLPAELLHLYDYDTSAPFDEQEIKSEEKDGAIVHDISYAGPNGRVTAFYIVPKGDGPFPAVLFMPGAPGARFTFFSEAVELAGRGISLLPDPPYARPPIQDVVEFTPSDRDGIVQEVVEMQRGFDFLLSKDEIDPSRLGYVGFSWGGSLGANFAAVERRVGSFVLMSAIPRLSADMRQLGEERGAPGDLAGYEEAMKLIDPVNYLPHVAPNALFLQFGSEDTRPSPEMGHEVDDAASKPKQATWYEGGHELNDEARAEREEWLAERLGAS
jgi:pimeloyl-ACP methyl ester carboxylesterase